MRRMIFWTLALAVLAVPGCSEPLKDDQAHNIMTSCCESARERVASIKDVESDRFRERCNSCRQGKTKGDCSAGARRVFAAVVKAFPADMLPLECNTMHTQFKAMGMEFEKPN